MILNETQQKVLFKIGLSPGTNALAIAKELDRDQSGINKICKALRKKGMVSATEGKNIKTATVNRLRLTLLGFAFVVDAMYRGSSAERDGRDPSPEYHSEFSSLLHNNQDLHEALGIFAEYFSFATEGDTRAVKSHWASRRLWASFEKHIEAYEFVAARYSDNLGSHAWNNMIHDSLYRELFFTLWFWLAKYPSADEGDVDFFSTKLVPRFRESAGWPLILEEMEDRESECHLLKTLRSLIEH